MAEKRMVASEIFEDEFFIELDMPARLLWIGLIVKMADDQGRLSANPLLIKSNVFPVDNISVQKIKSSLDIFEKSGKIHRYQIEDKQIYQIVNWWKHQNHQWPAPSKYPAPDGWTDRIKHHVTGNKVEKINWDKAGGFNGVPTDLPTDLPTECDSEKSVTNLQGEQQLYDDDDEYDDDKLKDTCDSEKTESRVSEEIDIPAKILNSEKKIKIPEKSQVEKEKKKPEDFDYWKFLGANQKAGYTFYKSTNIIPLQREFGKWNRGFQDLVEAGITQEDIPKVVAEMRRLGLTINAPQSILAVGRDMKAKNTLTEQVGQKWERM